MIDALTVLSGISILLMIGILSSILSNKLKISNILFLLIFGLIIGNTEFSTLPVFQFPDSLVVSLAILTLLIIVFDGCTKFKLREMDRLSNKILELVLIYLFFNIVVVGLTTYLLFLTGFGIVNGLVLGAIFAIIISGTDPSGVFLMLDKTRKVFEFLKIEAVINTPIIVILPFVIIEILQSLKTVTLTTIVNFIVPIIQQLVTGVGAGILMAIIVFRIMRKYYSPTLSRISIIATALLTYIIAENLKGNGVLAVATLGIVFGSIALKSKESLIKFSEAISMSLEILVFILVGISVKLPFNDVNFWLFSLLLFVLMTGTRFGATFLSLKKEKYSTREKSFISLFLPKGVSVAVVALALKSLNIPGMTIVADLLIVTMLYSILFSIILAKLSNRILLLNKPEKRESA